jgi:hypothetical protein
MVMDEQKHFKNENSSLKAELSKMKLQLIEARGSSGGVGGRGSGEGGGSGGGDSSLLRKQLHESEIQKHQLTTKITMLTEELEAYKNYMKTTVVKYKQEIAAMKKLQNAS